MNFLIGCVGVFAHVLCNTFLSAAVKIGNARTTFGAEHGFAGFDKLWPIRAVNAVFFFAANIVTQPPAFDMPVKSLHNVNLVLSKMAQPAGDLASAVADVK